jgi:hypothetical protein
MTLSLDEWFHKHSAFTVLGLPDPADEDTVFVGNVRNHSPNSSYPRISEPSECYMLKTCHSNRQIHVRKEHVLIRLEEHGDFYILLALSYLWSLEHLS